MANTDQVQRLLTEVDQWNTWRESNPIVRLDLRVAWLVEANLQEAKLYEADLQEANLYRANLEGADLRDATLLDADLQCANLRDAILEGANLLDTNLRYANLKDVNLRGAYLAGANLRGANLRGADLWCANLWRANITDVTWPSTVPAPIPGLAGRVLAQIQSHPQTWDQSVWHSFCLSNPCGSAHCVAGWTIVLAGRIGAAAEEALGTPLAAAFLLGVPTMDCPFGADDGDKVIPWLQSLVANQKD